MASLSSSRFQSRKMRQISFSARANLENFASFSATSGQVAPPAGNEKVVPSKLACLDHPAILMGYKRG